MKRNIFSSLCLAIVLSLGCNAAMAIQPVVSRTNQQMAQMHHGNGAISVSTRGTPMIEKGPKKVSIGVKGVPLRDAQPRDSNKMRSTDFFGFTASSLPVKANTDKEGAPKNGTVFYLSQPTGASKAFDNGTVTFP
jgi:hypothetical protein